MRIARLLTDQGHANAKLSALLDSTELDVLQLDYFWSALDSFFPQSYASGFFAELERLHKTMFLDPRLRVLTNAGGASVVDCIEKLAEQLCEHGSSDLLVSAVRGENLIHRLEEIHAEGVPLVDKQQQIDLMAMKQPVLSAQVELGAGPFATALNEGARIVIAGCYDPVAPGIAAAVSAHDWSWDSWNLLAAAAVASEINLQSNCLVSGELQTAFINPTGDVEFHPAPNSEKLLGTNTSEANYADVVSESRNLQIAADEFGIGHLQGVKGTEPTTDWVLRVKFESGFNATAMFSFSSDGGEEEMQAVSATLASILKELQLENGKTEQFTLNCDKNSGIRFLRVAASSNRESDCQEFVRTISNFVACHKMAQRSLVEFPVMRQAVSELQIPIPRDVVDVSVDTRPANEWY